MKKLPPIYLETFPLKLCKRIIYVTPRDLSQCTHDNPFRNTPWEKEKSILSAQLELCVAKVIRLVQTLSTKKLTNVNISVTFWLTLHLFSSYKLIPVYLFFDFKIWLQKCFHPTTHFAHKSKGVASPIFTSIKCIYLLLFSFVLISHVIPHVFYRMTCSVFNLYI